MGQAQSPCHISLEIYQQIDNNKDMAGALGCLASNNKKLRASKHGVAISNSGQYYCCNCVSQVKAAHCCMVSSDPGACNPWTDLHITGV